MKKLVITSIIMLVLGCQVSAQQKEYAGKMHVSPLVLEQRGDSVYINLRFDISGVNVDSRRSISLIPVLVSPEKKLNLSEVMVKGRQNYNVYRRDLALMSNRQREQYNKTAPYAVLEGFKSNNNKAVDYRKAVKFEPWMVNAKLDMYEDLCGCGNPPRRMGVSELVNLVALEKVIMPYELAPHLAYVQPAAEAIKRREISGEAFLDFAVSKSDIRADFMNNPRELKRIMDLISEIKSDKSITVRSINVIGYASPEGTLAGNQKLSEGRATALVNYLLPRFDYPRSMYSVVFGGENWDGLKDAVRVSDMPHREQVLDILENVPAQIDFRENSSRKKALMDLRGGEPYRFMVKEYYPSLRKAICKVDFDVQNFDVNQAKEIAKSKPQNLSLNEMFHVANTYEKGSQDFIDLFETAVRLFPADVTANLNAASAALARKDLVSAERYLDKIKGQTQAAEYHNALGTLMMYKSDYDGAEMELTRAANSGLVQAKHNLEELDRKRENIKEIKKKLKNN